MFNINVKQKYSLYFVLLFSQNDQTNDFHTQRHKAAK